MAFDFTLTRTIPAKPQEVCDAWLDSKGHSAMTGAKAKASPQQGAAFAVWAGDIFGRTLKLEPGRRIVPSGRTTKFTSK
jgi:uncharacterized protein YndB with AHSA1/START domain